MRRKLLVSVLVALGVLTATASSVSPSKVPPQAIQSAVVRSKPLLDRAWQMPVAITFKRDISWQSNRSSCGPASIANAFRSLGEEAITEPEVLAGTGRCWLLGFCIPGLTLDELADVARVHSTRRVTVLRDLTEDDFRTLLREANDPARRYIVNFSRDRIFGAGGGHHSPIGGYLEDEDLVFVLDVNRNFQPWLVERSRLYEAMNTFDGSKKRGLLLIE